MNNKEIIQAFKKLNTSTISDALDSLGIKDRVVGFTSRSSNTKMVGFAFTVEYRVFEEPVVGFHNAGNYIDNVIEDEVIVVNNNKIDYCTTWGGILTQVALKNNVAGVVVHGAIRDVDEIKNSQLPVFSQHVFMCSGKNRVYKFAEQQAITLDSFVVNPKDLVVGDENGVLFIPAKHIIECLERAIIIEETESKILQAVLVDNMSLQEARNKYRYDQPWLKNK